LIYRVQVLLAVIAPQMRIVITKTVVHIPRVIIVFQKQVI